jgi:hypothetical protein
MYLDIIEQEHIRLMRIDLIPVLKKIKAEIALERFKKNSSYWNKAYKRKERIM